MQKKVLRTIFKKKRYKSITDKFAETRTLTVFERFVYELFKYIVELTTSTEQNWLSILRQKNINK